MSRNKLPDDLLDFFRRVSVTLDQGIEDNDEDFLVNVFARLSSNELRLSRDKVVCCILEKVLRVARPVHIHGFLCSTLENLDRFVTDKYASHVIQNALGQCLRVSGSQLCDDGGGGGGGEGEEEVSSTSLCNTVLKIMEGIIGKLNAYAFDVYGSHVVCALIQVLSGVRVVDEVTRSRVSRTVAQKKTGGGNQENATSDTAEIAMSELPEEFSSGLDTFIDAFTSMRDFSHCLTDRSGSKVLQTLLYCTNKRAEKRCKHLCRQVLTACKVLPAKDEEKVHVAHDNGGAAAITRLAEDAIASHGLECIFKVASPKLIQRLCQQCMSGQLLVMALHPSGNYVVQKLCDALTTSSQLELVLQELLDHLEDILAVCHFGVPVALVKAAARLDCHHDELLRGLLSAFHASDSPRLCCRAFLSLSALDSLDQPVPNSSTSAVDDGAEEKEALQEVGLPVCPQGCLLVASIFSLSDPGEVVESFVSSLSRAELVSLATNGGSGSRVFEAFCSCDGASSKLKRKLVKKLKGEFVHLACHKQGSYVVDTCYKNTGHKSRSDIAEELLSQEQKLRENFFGKHVFRNCDLENYWVQKSTAGIGKKRQFADGDDYYSVSASKNKKKKLF